jgi:hypothetical protein
MVGLGVHESKSKNITEAIQILFLRYITTPKLGGTGEGKR